MKMRNELRKNIASAVNKRRKNKLRWFGHEIRSEEMEAVRVVMKMNYEGRRGIKRPKIDIL